MQKKWLIFIVAILIMGRVWAADSLVWQISRQNKTHGYLIGTMHTAPKNFRLPENMRLAMKNTKKLILESHLDDELAYSPVIQTLLLATSSEKTLGETLGAARLAKLRWHFSGSPQVSPQFNPQQKIALWVIWMEMEYLFFPSDFSQDNGVDKQLLTLAKQQKKPINGLETIEPIEALAKIPNDKIIRSMDTMLAHATENQRLAVKLWQLYAAQNTTKLMVEINNPENEKLLSTPQDIAYFKNLNDNILLKQRNQNWLPKIIAQLGKQPTTIAVGTAHLFGENGLIRLLKQRGYTLTPIAPQN